MKNSSYLHKDGIIFTIKPTLNCNASCAYCGAYNEDHDLQIMSIETLEKLIFRLDEYIETASLKYISLDFYGGEPLLAGIDYYKKVHELLKPIEKKVELTKTIITNLILFNEEYAHLFKEMNMRISSSIDAYDGIRNIKNGDYLEVWIDKYKLAQSFGFKPGAVCVIHKMHLKNLPEFFNFFQNLYYHFDGKFSLQFNAIYAEGRAKDTYDETGITPLEWGEFMYQLYLWHHKSAKYLSVSNIDLINRFVYKTKGGPNFCNYMSNCADIAMAIAPNGDVYNCGKQAEQSPEPYGNLIEKPISEIIQNPKRKALYGRSEKLKKTQCKDCELWEQCHGGCPEAGKSDSGEYTNKFYFCESFKYVYSKLKDMDKNELYI
jgi:uncharacterized protein